MIAQLALESWHWREQQAAAFLRRTPWSAGVRLMQIAKPREASEKSGVAWILKENANTLAGCRTRPGHLKVLVKRQIEIELNEHLLDGMRGI